MSSSSRSGYPRRIPRPGRRGSSLLFALTAAVLVGGCPGGVPAPMDLQSQIQVEVHGDGAGLISWVGDPDTHWTGTCAKGGSSDTTCLNTGPEGSGTLTLRASPAAGSLFVDWFFDCTGTSLSCSLEWTAGGTFLQVGAEFVLVPTAVTVTLSDDSPLQPGTTIQATATATPPADDTLRSVEYTWASSDPNVASITGSGTQVSVTALAAGTTEITASARGVTSDPDTVTVTAGTPPLAYTRSAFAQVSDAYNLDFDTDGNIFVGNTGASDRSTLKALVRKVTTAGDTMSFGEPVADPDVVIVDRGGAISTLGANTVLAAGAYDTQFNNNHVTEIKADGSVTQPLVERAPPLFSNPGALAILPNGDLLVGNNANNSVSRVHRVSADSLAVTHFYTDPDAPSSLRSMAVVDDVVYVITGSKKLTALDVDGNVIDLDIWPSFESNDPILLAAGLSGSLEGYLIATGKAGRVWRIDPVTHERVQIGDFAFSGTIGVGVSPADGILYVMDGSGIIWKVTEG